MAFTIALALLAQGPTLDADPSKAAMTCAAASSAVSDSARQTPERYLEGVAEATYFAMTAARPGAPGGPFVARMSARIEELGKGPMPSLADANALLPQCDIRFPLARRKGASRLPAGALDRNVMCAGVAIFLSGAARGYNENLDPALQWVTPLRERFQGLVDAERAPGGALAAPAVFQEQFAAQLAASLDYGNLTSVARACRALPA